MNNINLKNKLSKWQENDWTIPEDINKVELSLELMEALKSTDPILRDELALSFLWKMIMEDMLEELQIRELLKLALSENHLFYKLGAEEDDSVFNRAFTILIIRWIIKHHNDKVKNDEHEILSKEEVLDCFNKVMEYLNREKDVRGYVENKGWAHSAAHTGDALVSFAGSHELAKEQLLQILEGIKDKVSICYYVYRNEEAERLTTACIELIKRDDMDEGDIVEWIRSFNELEVPKEYQLSNALEAYKYTHSFKENVKNFLRSLYFRLKFKGMSPIIINEIEVVLNNFNEFYNNK
ncbi:DUF2785 domain-containing protein [Oceanirhabdus sp. W0125-5]|uniref:DUF2785 domain-containing protein n=1 Tax=Oceanirhabdus sp. W0125-5 TaxID=2999116 RepID=UPI0022F2A9E7|nr:DUF2785 domain-containing protein [Oceanirhabdus sp. W0125-5]WBW97805.1 DUF2785 domain-containing protein [Oceanirhabdus sp. W0125-5]